MIVLRRRPVFAVFSIITFLSHRRILFALPSRRLDHKRALFIFTSVRADSPRQIICDTLYLCLGRHYRIRWGRTYFRNNRSIAKHCTGLSGLTGSLISHLYCSISRSSHPESSTLLTPLSNLRFRPLRLVCARSGSSEAWKTWHG